ncbi:MAG: hypothetical protein A4E66_02513 [Syntrophus sp. PtaB.Bin001]|nr:MAG: hypothetical protein A4E66_02513 [Syntrophus sp. PtaB.Bin001]
MGTEICKIALENAKCCLELRTKGDHIRIFTLEKERLGRVATGTADHNGIAFDDCNYRIVTAHQDVPVVQKKIIGDAFKAGKRFTIFFADWFLDLIRACHHKSGKIFLKKQMMQRRIRQHNTLVRYSRRYGRCNHGFFSLAAKHNRALLR